MIRTKQPGRRDRRRTYRRPVGLAVLAAAAAVGLAACGGGPSTPHVANLGTTTTSGTGRGSGGSATTVANANPTAVLNQWAACMRAHGDPNQADPTIDANKRIRITWDPDIPGGYNGTNKGGQGNSGPGQYCRSYLTEAQTALQGGQSPKPPDPAELLKFSECMRAKGIPDFPDPSGDNLTINLGGGLDPSNPTFQNASKVCAQKTGVRGFGGTPPPGTIMLNGAGPLPND